MAKRGHGEGTITRNEARNRWEGRVTIGYDDNGRQMRRKVTGSTRGEVVKRLRELVDADQQGQAPAPAGLTVRRFLEQWLTDVLPGSVTLRTEQGYAEIVRLYIVPHLGQKRLRTLQARDVSRMLRDLEAEGRAPNTRRLARAVLRRALRWAEAEGMVSRNVAALADGVKLGRPDNAAKAMTVAEARTFLEHIRGDQYEAAFVVGLALGLRRGEILALAWTDLDLDATPPRLTVQRGLIRLKGRGLTLNDTKTRGSRRTVHLPSQVVDALRRHRVRQAEERLVVGPEWPALPLGADLLFRTPFGTPVDPDNFWAHCSRVTEAAGVGRRSPHQLRHSAASLLVAQGVPMKLVSELLGHSSIAVTSNTYAHIYAEGGAVAAAAMSSALWGES